MIVICVTIVHDSQYSLNENFKIKEKRVCTDEDRNVLCKVCECQDFNHVFLSALRRCSRDTFVTLFSSFCKFRFETINSLIFFLSIDDSRDIVDWNVDSWTNHCESWNDRSKCNKHEDLKAKIQEATKMYEKIRSTMTT